MGGRSNLGGAMALEIRSNQGTPDTPRSGLGRQSRAVLPGRQQTLADNPGAKKPSVGRALRGRRGSVTGLPAAIRALAKRDSMSLPPTQISRLHCLYYSAICAPRLTVSIPSGNRVDEKAIWKLSLGA